MNIKKHRTTVVIVIFLVLLTALALGGAALLNGLDGRVRQIRHNAGVLVERMRDEEAPPDLERGTVNGRGAAEQLYIKWNESPETADER